MTNGSTPLAGFLRTDGSPSVSTAPPATESSSSAGKPPTRSERLRNRKRSGTGTTEAKPGGEQSASVPVAAPSVASEAAGKLSKKELRKLERKARREAQRDVFKQIEEGKLVVPEHHRPAHPPDALDSQLFLSDRREDAQILEAALTKRWPINPAKKLSILNRLIHRAETTRDNRLLLACVRELRLMEGQNQADERRESEDTNLNFTQNNVVVYLPDNGRDDRIVDAQQ